MKNVMLISQSLTGGGAEKVAANLSKILSKKTNVFLVTYSQTENEYSYGGLRININCLGGNVNFVKKMRNAFYRIQKLSYLKKKYKIDYSISFIPQTDYANVFSHGIHEKKIIEVSSNSSKAFSSFWSRLFRKYILKKADYIVCVSEGSKSDLISNFGINKKIIKTIYNPCDVSKIKLMMNDSADYSFEFDSLNYIIAIGSFRKPKGHWHLIKAFSRVLNDYPDLKLVILGDGEYRNKYSELISNLKIPLDKVIMPGFLSNPYPILKKSKLFVFSSIYEGFGNVIIESMACGVPVLCTDCNYGPREILYKNGNVPKSITNIEMADYGGIVPHCGDGDIDITPHISEQEQMLANAMKEMLANTNLMKEYAKKGSIRCMDFDSQKFEDKWMDLLEKV